MCGDLLNSWSNSLFLTFSVLWIGWFGLKYYFTHINRIADRVRTDVFAQIQAHHSRRLSYNDIPATYRNAVIATEDHSFFTKSG